MKGNFTEDRNMAEEQNQKQELIGRIAKLLEKKAAALSGDPEVVALRKNLAEGLASELSTRQCASLLEELLRH